VNAAGYVRVDEAEREPELCRRENARAAAVLARACAADGIPLVTFSSDLVFDGRKGTPYVESDETRPLSVYGRSKAEAEDLVLAAHPEALVVRTSAFFGPWDAYNFVTLALRGAIVTAADDVRVSPTYVPDLVNAALDLLIDGEHGIWHLANDDEVSWAELAARAGARVEPVAASTLEWIAPRPPMSALSSERGKLLPPLDDALARYAATVGAAAVRRGAAA
jgi:dTDP-4-dehydrorhamnose reductase